MTQKKLVQQPQPAALPGGMKPLTEQELRQIAGGPQGAPLL